MSSSNYNTYYSDYAYVNASRLAYAGGSWSSGSSAGAFHLIVDPSASATTTNLGVRLMYLN